VPGILVASLFGWSARPFFDAEPAADQRPEARLQDESPDR
jgi:hypothetical protein